MDAEYKVLFQKCQVLADQIGGHIDITHDSPEEYYRKAVFVPFLSHVVVQLNERFKKHNTLLSSIKKIISITAFKVMPVSFNTVPTSTKLFFWRAAYLVQSLSCELQSGKISMKPCNHHQQSLSLPSAVKFFTLMSGSSFKFCLLFLSQQQLQKVLLNSTLNTMAKNLLAQHNSTGTPDKPSFIKYTLWCCWPRRGRITVFKWPKTFWICSLRRMTWELLLIIVSVADNYISSYSKFVSFE